MIDEKKLIETIVNTPSKHQDDCCLEILEGMATRQHEILDIIKEQPKTDWIPCEERLPNRSINVLVLFEEEAGENIICKGWLNEFNNWECWDDTKPYCKDVIAWQPLPAPNQK